jgi:hypothetical protein
LFGSKHSTCSKRSDVDNKNSQMGSRSQRLYHLSKWLPLYSEPCLKLELAAGGSRTNNSLVVSAPGRPWGDGPCAGLHLQPSHYFYVYCVVGSAPGRTGHLYPSHDLSAAKGFAEQTRLGGGNQALGLKLLAEGANLLVGEGGLSGLRGECGALCEDLKEEGAGGGEEE